MSEADYNENVSVGDPIVFVDSRGARNDPHTHLCGTCGLVLHTCDGQDCGAFILEASDFCKRVSSEDPGMLDPLPEPETNHMGQPDFNWNAFREWCDPRPGFFHADRRLMYLKQVEPSSMAVNALLGKDCE